MEESLVTSFLDAYVEYLAEKYGKLETKIYTRQGVSGPSWSIHGVLNVMGKEVSFQIPEKLLIHSNADEVKKELLHVEAFYKAQCPTPAPERPKMTVLSLLNALNAAIAENPSIMNARVLVDVDAQKYDYHLADASTAHVEDEIHEGAPTDKMVLISLNR